MGGYDLAREVLAGLRWDSPGFEGALERARELLAGEDLLGAA